MTAIPKTLDMLDDKDRKLIACLRDNARMPLTELGRALCLSRSAVQERLARLRCDGIILGFTLRTRLSEAADVKAWLFIKVVQGVACCHVGPLLLKELQVVQCYALAGEWDLLVMVTARDTDDLARVRQRIGAVPGLAHIQTQLVMAVHAEA